MLQENVKFLTTSHKKAWKTAKIYESIFRPSRIPYPLAEFQMYCLPEKIELSLDRKQSVVGCYPNAIKKFYSIPL